MSQKGYIYAIQNLVNQKIYIGQSINVIKRWEYHISHMKKLADKYPLYKDMYEYDISQFIFRILESNIPINLLDEREQYYILKYNSIQNGYNIQIGGKIAHTQKLTQQEINHIYQLLRDRVPMPEIAQLYQVNTSTISDINCGDTWFNPNIEYPIRKQKYKKKNFSENDIQTIYDLLRKNITLTDIAKQYQTSIQTISKINKGDIYHHDIEYPINIYTKNMTRLTKQTIKEIAYELQNTTINYVQLSKHYRVDRHTIAEINKGNRYVKFLNELGYTKFPLRKIQ